MNKFYRSNHYKLTLGKYKGNSRPKIRGFCPYTFIYNAKRRPSRGIHDSTYYPERGDAPADVGTALGLSLSCSGESESRTTGSTAILSLPSFASEL